jgi:hypothetical protein
MNLLKIYTEYTKILKNNDEALTTAAVLALLEQDEIAEANEAADRADAEKFAAESEISQEKIEKLIQTEIIKIKENAYESYTKIINTADDKTKAHLQYLSDMPIAIIKKQTSTLTSIESQSISRRPLLIFIQEDYMILTKYRQNNEFIPVKNYLITNFILQNVAGDGNCFYNSISLIFYTNEKSNMIIRNAVCDNLSTRKDEFRAYIGDPVYNDIFLNDNCNKNGRWSNHLDVQTVAIIYNIIVVVNYNFQYILIFEPNNDGLDTNLKNNIPVIWIYNTNNVHYQAFIRK